MTLYTAIKTLSEFGWGNILIIFVLGLIALVACLELLKKLPELLGYETKLAIKERELNEKIKQMETDIANLQTSAATFKSDRIHDREQSFEKQHDIDNKIDGVQTTLSNIINEVTKTQKEIIKKVDDLAEQSRKYQLADMRETLLQAHRYYTSDSTNKFRMWTELEKHAWDEQYEVYVLNKGNGYMQNIIKPEMDKLRVVSLDDYETMAELMSSRTQHKD